MVAPDGRLYRFGDAGRSWSGRDLRAEVRDVLEWEKNWGGEGGPDLSAHFGLIVWEWTAGGRVLRMVADVGPLGNEANPGHGHADALSFCLYVDGEELVTDPGTFSYCSDPASTWFKLQEAHSTVHWIDTPSHQLSGYYHWKRLVDRPEITAGGAPSQRVLEATQQWCVGRSRFEHRRSWTANDAGLVVVDRLKCPVRERAASRLQLAPGTQVETERDGSVLLESRNGVRLRIIARTSVAALARRAEGWYAEAYGRRCAAPAVEWHLDRGSASRQLQLDLAVIP
jgi:hypothetical protein